MGGLWALTTEWSGGLSKCIARLLLLAQNKYVSPRPPPIIEHAQSKMYRADQAEQTAVPMSLIAWTGSGEGTPTVVFLLRLLQEQISRDS